MQGRGSPVRVVVMSDIHSKESIFFSGEDVSTSTFPSLPRGDILIVAGDFTQSGQVEEYQSFNSFLRALCARKIYRHIVLVAGNHERTLDEDFYHAEGWRYDRVVQDPAACRDALFTNLPANVHFLLDSSVILEGLMIYGTPWVIGGDVFSSETSAAHYRWGFSVSESSLETKWSMIPSNTDILVTHQPPYAAGDIRRNYDLDTIINDQQIFGFDHRGSRSLMESVRQIKPLLHVCGHEHRGYGAYSYFDCPTLILNASVCDEDYIPSNPLLVIDLEARCPSRIVSYTLEGNGATLAYHPSGMNLYISSILSLQMNSITLSDQDQEIFNSFLMLITSRLESIPCRQLPPGFHAPEGLVSTLLGVLGISDNCLVQNLVNEYTRMIYLVLDRHALLSRLYDYRCLAISADEDSAEDFRRMQLIVPRIYLGPEYAAQDLSYLREVGITHIVNCSGTTPAFPTDLVSLSLEVEDTDQEDISRYFGATIEWMNDALRLSNSKILVYCRLGLSRSPTIVIAYLMSTMNISFSIAHSIVKRARGFITINRGFLGQLLADDQQRSPDRKLSPVGEQL